MYIQAASSCVQQCKSNRRQKQPIAAKAVAAIRSQ